MTRNWGNSRALGPIDRIRELTQADQEGKIPKYTIDDTIYDRFGDAWEVERQNSISLVKSLTGCTGVVTREQMITALCGHLRF